MGYGKLTMPTVLTVCRLPGRFMITEEDISRADAAGALRTEKGPVAKSAWYDSRVDRVFIALSTGYEIAFAPSTAQGLESATVSDLDTIEITPSGFGIHFPKLDADLYLPALIEGSMGSKKWMAAYLGAIGGSVTSTAKAEAARANGAKGGRPRKLIRSKTERTPV